MVQLETPDGAAEAEYSTPDGAAEADYEYFVKSFLYIQRSRQTSHHFLLPGI